MDKTALIFAMVGLLVFFIVLVTAYVIMGRSKKAVQPSEEAVTFEMFQADIERPSSTNTQLNRAVDTIIECYAQAIDAERPFDVYASLMEKLCVHPNTDSKVILRFQKALIAANPRYKGQMEKALKVGLAARGKR